MSIAYHEAELEIALNPADPHYSLPLLPKSCRSLLDVGCGIGQSLIAMPSGAELRRVGLDPDREAIEHGRNRFPGIELVCGTAESLPFQDGEFDAVMSRVSLPYTNIPVALAEIHRVLSPGGFVWLTLHPPSMWRQRVREERQLRGFIFLAYVAVNSLFFRFTGKLFRYPLNRSRMQSMQTEKGIRRALEATGFKDIRVTREPRFVVTAVRL
jgi:ubiquinone/menaquinone biosynthesis C-methylase UbiE